MKLLDFLFLLLIVILFIFLTSGIYLLFKNLQKEAIEFETYNLKFSENVSEKSIQFYPNMRYQEASIGYYLEPNCSPKKKNDAKQAFEILNQKTILNFYEDSIPEINVLCSQIAPEPEQKEYFIAGEGGPVQIINTTRFSIIFSGKVSLYRPETCPTSQIAVHEILHALGFDHNKNISSIMYPETKCSQQIDTYIIDEINRLYSTPSLTDLAIETITANKTGRYLNFKLTIANQGLKDSVPSLLSLFSEDSRIKTFDIEKINIGSKRTITVTNLAIPRNTEQITFLVETTQPEISKENNQVKIGLIKSS